MIIEKAIKKPIEVDVNDMYAVDQEAMLIRKCTEECIGMCYQSILILGVTKILDRTDPKSNADRSGGKYQVTVHFVVRGIEMTTGDIVTGCEVIEINERNMVLTTQYTGIMMNKPNMPYLKRGDTVPVRIISAHAFPKDKRIGITAEQLLPKTTALHGVETAIHVTESDVEAVQMLWERLKPLLEKKRGSREDHFHELLYPFSKPAPKTPSVPVYQIKPGTYMITVYDWLPDAHVQAVKTDKPGNEPAAALLKSVLLSSIKHWEAVDELAEQYPDTKSDAHLEPFWAAYKKARLPVK